MAGHGVQHVVEEADAGLALALAGAVELERQADVGLACGAGDVERIGSRAALHRLGVDGKALGARQRGACGRQPRGRLAGQGYARHPAPECGRPTARSEKRAAPPVGSTWLEPAT